MKIIILGNVGHCYINLSIISIASIFSTFSYRQKNIPSQDIYVMDKMVTPQVKLYKV